jgi:RNase P/RNase MRP subunit p30
MPHDITLFKQEGSLYFIRIKRSLYLDKNEDYEGIDGLLIDGEEDEARKIFQSIKAKKLNLKLAVVARDDTYNRRILDTLKIDYLVSPELNPRIDTLKQRSSGLNHVLATIARDKGVTIVINLSNLISIEDPKIKSILISRTIQNILVCRKANCKIKFATFAKFESELLDEKQVFSIGTSLKMSSQQAKEAFEY